MSNTKLYPLLKYPGGKESELKYINKALPPIYKITKFDIIFNNLLGYFHVVLFSQ